MACFSLCQPIMHMIAVNQLHPLPLGELYLILFEVFLCQHLASNGILTQPPAHS